MLSDVGGVSVNGPSKILLVVTVNKPNVGFALETVSTAVVVALVNPDASAWMAVIVADPAAKIVTVFPIIEAMNPFDDVKLQVPGLLLVGFVKLKGKSKNVLLGIENDPIVGTTVPVVYVYNVSDIDDLAYVVVGC